VSQPFFIGIPNAKDVRRQLLSDAKTTIEALRGYEAYMELRHDKLDAIVKLKHLLQELVVLNRRIKSRMPKIELPKIRTAPVSKGSKKPVKQVVKKKNPVAELEDTLSQIEDRLKALE
jgi:hypothetical protein